MTLSCKNKIDFRTVSNFVFEFKQFFSKIVEDKIPFHQKKKFKLDNRNLNKFFLQIRKLITNFDLQNWLTTSRQK
jgi:hypothetical protein